MTSPQGVFVITGGSRGMGREIACVAAEAGYSVALLARGAADLQTAAAYIHAAAPRAALSTYACDVSQANEVAKVFMDIAAKHGQVRGLINNAATWTGGKTIAAMSAEEMQASLNLNFMGAFHTTQAALRQFVPGSDLAIINIGATASLRGSAGHAAFCVAKGALRTFSQSLAKEMGPAGVHVAHLIIDGLIANERTKGLNRGRAEDRYIKMRSLAREVMHVALQAADCWTFEWDVRTHNAEW